MVIGRRKGQVRVMNGEDAGDAYWGSLRDYWPEAADVMLFNRTCRSGRGHAEHIWQHRIDGRLFRCAGGRYLPQTSRYLSGASLAAEMQKKDPVFAEESASPAGLKHDRQGRDCGAPRVHYAHWWSKSGNLLCPGYAGEPAPFVVAEEGWLRKWWHAPVTFRLDRTFPVNL